MRIALPKEEDPRLQERKIKSMMRVAAQQDLSTEFEKRLNDWEPITLRLLQNVPRVIRQMQQFAAQVAAGTITGAEMRAFLVINLQKPLDAYQKTIYFTYKVFLEDTITEFEHTPEGEEIVKKAASAQNILKNFEINAKLIESICVNIFKLADNLQEQFDSLQKIFSTRLPELQRQVSQQEEDMHKLLEEYRAAKAALV